MSPKKDFEIRDYTQTNYQQLLQLWDLTGLRNVARGDDKSIVKNTINIGIILLIMRYIKFNVIIGI